MTTPPENDHPLYQQPQHPNEEANPNEPAQPRKRPPRPPEDRPYLTYGLIAVNLVIFALGFASPELQQSLFVSGSLYPPFVVEGGEYYRLLTVMFLHGNIAHIFFNMYALYIVGVSLEPIFGRVRFALIYFLGGLGGSVLSLLLGSYEVPSVGASGAVFAIFTAYAVHLYQHRTLYRNVRAQLQQMIFVIGANILFGFLPGSRVDNWGHIGGLIGGAILAWRMAPRIGRPTHIPRSMRDLAQFDTNPLVKRLPDIVIYCLGLLVLFTFALNTVGA